MATDSYVEVEDAGGVTRKIANVEFSNSNGDTVEMQRTGDYFNGSEYLDDQTGGGSVLTFNFSANVQLVYVRVWGSGNTGRVTVNGVAPTSSKGAVVGGDETLPLPANTSTVKVLVNTGVVVSVWGLRF